MSNLPFFSLFPLFFFAVSSQVAIFSFPPPCVFTDGPTNQPLPHPPGQPPHLQQAHLLFLPPFFFFSNFSALFCRKVVFFLLVFVPLCPLTGRLDINPPFATFSFPGFPSESLSFYPFCVRVATQILEPLSLNAFLKSFAARFSRLFFEPPPFVPLLTQPPCSLTT